MLDLEALVDGTLAGDLSAWQKLQAAVQPKIVGIARHHVDLRRAGLADSPDDLAEIATASLERLERAEFRNLKRFALYRAQPDPQQSASFDAWLRGAVDFVIREHLRARFGRGPGRALSQVQRPRLSKRDLQSHAIRYDDQRPARSFLEKLSLSSRLTVAQIFAYAEANFATHELAAIQLYYQEDRGFPEIARQLGLAEVAEAERLIRRLNARLRQRFVAASLARTGDDA